MTTNNADRLAHNVIVGLIVVLVIAFLACFGYAIYTNTLS